MFSDNIREGGVLVSDFFEKIGDELASDFILSFLYLVKLVVHLLFFLITL